MLGGSVGGRKGRAKNFFLNWFSYLLIVLSFRGFIGRERSGGL
jgi:hypothetical protein